MAEIETVVDVDHLAHLLESIERKLSMLGQPNETDNSTIFRVPYKIRQSKENLFDPSVISIGPFHRGKTSLKAMEEQKLLFLRDFLSRGDGISLNLCLLKMKELEGRTRRCYSENFPDLSSDSFVEMMLLDGCFVSEYFLKWYERRLSSIGHSVFIPSDFHLLENQIPFFIVEKLCDIGLKQEHRMDFKQQLVNVFARLGPTVLDDSIIRNPPSEIHHFVHLCYNYSMPIILEEPVVSSSESFCPSMLSRITDLYCYPFCSSLLTLIKYFLLEFFLWVLTILFPTSNSLSFFSPKYTRKRSMVIPCATQLQNAGIKLKPNSKPYFMLNISFDHHVLKIPTLTITNGSKTFLANLIAFEQCKLEENQEMRAILSSYALFLDSLVNTLEDVKILQKCGIVNNGLDSEEELTDFFNQICEGMNAQENHFFHELFVQVNNYCESSWGRRRATWNRHKKQFIDKYFRSPWTAISLVGAVLVVLFTCVQTVFAVLAYFKDRKRS